MQPAHHPIICAIDTTNAWKAGKLARDLRGTVGAIKLGLEFYTAAGRQGVQEVVKQNTPLFLDLKFHDIPATVEGAIRATAGLNAAMLTVHAAGGYEMLRRAVDASAEVAQHTGSKRPLILAVTMLTSLENSDLKALGMKKDMTAQVLRLAELAASARVDGVVCSPLEIAAIRERFPSELLIVTPGIRPEGAPGHDQKRTLTPKEALERGADYLVIGRPITEADNPLAAAKEIAATLSG